jgi:hypothetical protein
MQVSGCGTSNSPLAPQPPPPSMPMTLHGMGRSTPPPPPSQAPAIMHSITAYLLPGRIPTRPCVVRLSAQDVALQAPALGQTLHQQRLRRVPRQARLRAARLTGSARARWVLRPTHSKTQRMYVCSTTRGIAPPPLVLNWEMGVLRAGLCAN